MAILLSHIFFVHVLHDIDYYPMLEMQKIKSKNYVNHILETVRTSEQYYVLHNIYSLPTILQNTESLMLIIFLLI